MAVFVLDQRGQPLMPCGEKRARLLLQRGRARVHRVAPFVIRMVDRTVADSELQPVRVKLDPGSKTTGIALVREAEDGSTVLNLFELEHRGAALRDALKARAALRRGRRHRKTRYRAPRFLNRTRPAGWLAPSLRHRLETTLSWVDRLRRWAPVVGIAQERVRFDLQALDNPDLEGVEYQRGTLAGTEKRAYLLAGLTPPENGLHDETLDVVGEGLTEEETWALLRVKWTYVKNPGAPGTGRPAD